MLVLFVDMIVMKLKPTLYLLAILIVISVSGYAATGPTLLMDKNPDGTDFIGAIGPSIKYKRISAPYDFGGDMTVWGLRLFGGKLRDPALGVMYQAGTLNGTSMKFNLDMAGLTLEDSFREDSRVMWRVSFGVGNYKLRTIVSGTVLNKGSFTFCEPMIFGVLPLSRHIVLEIGTGYTFAGATGVRIEGLAIQTELLIGKF